MGFDLFFITIQAVVLAYYSGRTRGEVPAAFLLLSKAIYFGGVVRRRDCPTPYC